jgi:thioesterase domain-containing protein
MLLPVQTSGDKPPLFFVHGLHGVMPLGRTFAEGLGPNQPLYAIHANGIDGRRPVIDNMPDMVRAYADEIQEACPTGRLVIGGMCDGGPTAIEIARELREKGRHVGPVILADPPAIPRVFHKENPLNDPQRPQIAQQLRERLHQQLLAYASRPYNDMPFEADDPKQLELAVLAGVGSLVALSRHVPRPFPGSAQLIVSDRRAGAFFHPEMHWHKLLPGPRMVHVLPWDHIQLFRAGRENVARALKFMLEEAPKLEMLAERQTEPDAPVIERLARAIDDAALQLAANHEN